MSQMKRQRELRKSEKAAQKRAKRHKSIKKQLPDFTEDIACLKEPSDKNDKLVYKGEVAIEQMPDTAMPMMTNDESIPSIFNFTNNLFFETSNMKSCPESSDYIIAYCGVCLNKIAHEIIVSKGDKPKRVRCLTCSNIHPYRVKPPVANKQAKEVAGRYQSLMKKSKVSHAKKYQMGVSFYDNDQIEHDKFGVGFVTRVLFDGKIEVLFSNGKRTLVHKR
ncbi:MAG: hypothetical protein JW841_05025 [Deltaproteobacteria bacterium]|nr:hypothetical protein [Deltaproteobacteria bacterium]